MGGQELSELEERDDCPLLVEERSSSSVYATRCITGWDCGCCGCGGWATIVVQVSAIIAMVLRFRGTVRELCSRPAAPRSENACCCMQDSLC